MIDKNDCLLLLTELKKNGVDTKDMMMKAIKSSYIDMDVLEFINKHRPLDVANFYEKIRKSYNDKHSILYKNIMLELSEDNVNEVITTLSSLALQICLFGKNVENKDLFYKHARLSEIYSCLYNYSTTFSIVNCAKLLQVVKADIKALESIK